MHDTQICAFPGPYMIDHPDRPMSAASSPFVFCPDFSQLDTRSRAGGAPWESLHSATLSTSRPTFGYNAWFRIFE